MAQIVLLSLVSASVAFTISETAIFRGTRQWLHAKNEWLGKLASCGYCLGHWIAFALVAIYRPRVFEGWRPLDFLLTAIVISWLAAFQWAALCWMMTKAER